MPCGWTPRRLQYNSMPCLLQHAMFALASHTKTTNRGMPIACFAFGLLGRHGQVAWAQVWLNVVQQALHDTQQRFPTFKVDFLLTEVSTDMLKPIFLRPMPRDRGLLSPLSFTFWEHIPVKQHCFAGPNNCNCHGSNDSSKATTGVRFMALYPCIVGMTPYQRWYFRAPLLNALQKASGHLGR